MEVAKITVVVDNVADPDTTELEKTLSGVELVITERLGVDGVLITGNDEETIGCKVVETELFWPVVEGGPKVSEGRELEKAEIEEDEKLATEDDGLMGTFNVVACVSVNELTTMGLDLDSFPVGLKATELDMEGLTDRDTVVTVTLVLTGTNIDWPTEEETTEAVVALELGVTS